MHLKYVKIHVHTYQTASANREFECFQFFFFKKKLFRMFLQGILRVIEKGEFHELMTILFLPISTFSIKLIKYAEFKMEPRFFVSVLKFS